MKEIWKDIEGYEGLYKVSDKGRVASLHPHNCKDERFQIIHQHKVRGYPRVELYRGVGRRKYLVHILVANAFIPKIEGKNEINHIDGNKLNNSVGNLEWCTRSENMKHAYDSGLVSMDQALYTRWGDEKWLHH